MQQPRRKGEKLSILVESCTRTFQLGKMTCSCLYRAYTAKLFTTSSLQEPTSSYKDFKSCLCGHISKFCAAVPSTQERDDPDYKQQQAATRIPDLVIIPHNFKNPPPTPWLPSETPRTVLYYSNETRARTRL